MASLIFKQMASSLTRQVLHISRFSVMLSSSPASSYACLRTLSAAPGSPLWSSARINSARPSPSLLGQCRAALCLQPCANMKTKSALKRRCKDCFFVRRRGRLFVFCKTHPRHKQRQG
uniref:Ribosomal protein n=1 Tax=Periophthalmus magnuspinnatus TaxID=409849 RepID=A0A3B3ZJ63_9GOBI